MFSHADALFLVIAALATVTRWRVRTHRRRSARAAALARIRTFSDPSQGGGG